jgi:hypothetical protein
MIRLASGVKDLLDLLHVVIFIQLELLLSHPSVVEVAQAFQGPDDLSCYVFDAFCVR